MLRPACFLLVLLMAGPRLVAQDRSPAGIWSAARGGKSIGDAKQKVSKKVSGLKAWKKHLQQWGLDTSYRHSLSAGGRLNSDGWSGAIIYANRTLANRLAIWQLSFSEVKEEKETKQQGTNGGFAELGNSSPYIFGKINNLYLLKLGYGREKTLLPAVLDGNVSIGFRWNGGVSLAMLKPYYLKLIYADLSTAPASAVAQEEQYSESNKDRFLNSGLILGRGGWSKGLSEMQYLPGAYAEAAITIMPRKTKAFIQTVTLGVSGSIYTTNLSLLAQVKSNPWEAMLFAGIEIGKRWK